MLSCASSLSSRPSPAIAIGGCCAGVHPALCRASSVRISVRARDVLVRASAGDDKSWDQPVFGMPMAPKEIWEKFQREAREGLQEQMRPGGDPVLAALYIAAEDDAVSTKSTVDLPVASFSKRLDALVRQLGHALAAHPRDFSDPQAAADHLAAYLFDDCGYAVAQKQLELYSPYRVYMHKVLAQRCGTPEALAALLAAFVRRSQDAGLVPEFAVEMGLREPGQFPLVRVKGSAGGGGSARWVEPLECVVICLDLLKRTNWSWVWDPAEDECFFEPAEAFLGAYGRAGKGSSVVGVMQATGRPFGDLSMALLATERLAQLRGGLAGGRLGAREVRDTGVLLCHMGRLADAKVALEGYQRWLQENHGMVVELPEEVKLPVGEESVGAKDVQREADVVDRLLIKLNQATLEQVYTES